MTDEQKTKFVMSVEKTMENLLKITDDILSKSSKQSVTVDELLLTFQELENRIYASASVLNISPNDEHGKKIQDMVHKTGNDIAKKVRESVAPKERTDLGPVEIPEATTRSKEEIEEELFDLHASKQDAISDAEKEEIQKKIKYLLRLYQEAKLRYFRKLGR